MLQLETQLEQERVRLGELRKRHYVLGGPGADGGEDDPESFPPPPPPTLLDSTPEPQWFPQAQPYLNTQSLPPVGPFSPAPAQPGLMPQSHAPTHAYSQSHVYAPPAQTYAAPQAVPSFRPYIPAQPIVLKPTQNYFSPRTNPPSHTSARARSPPLPKKTPQNNAETSRSSLKKPNIFTKSGNLLKNAVSSGYSLVMPPQGRWSIPSIFIPVFFFCHSSRKTRVELGQSLKGPTSEE